MRLLTLIVLALVSFSVLAEVNGELSGNIEGQFRHSKNNDEAQEDLFQDWEEADFYLAYGNLNGRLDFNNSRLEANWFLRYSQSELYDPQNNPIWGDRPYLATRIFTFPNKLVARDIFKLQYSKQDGDHQTESVLNKFYYEWDYDEHRFMIGRMYVNYGLGEIFNPMNPFNQPTGLTSIQQVAQGNDGVSFTFYVNDNHTIQFLLLGDKSVEGYDGQIDRTLWAHGEIQATDKLQLDYVVGEDQNRQKLGGQVAYRFEEAMVFTQVLYQSENVKGDPSDNLWDVLLGYDQQLTSKWHLRFEGGYQKRDLEQVITLDNFGDRFLPTEYFVAFANVFELHPLFKLSATLVNDLKSGFTYGIGKGTLDLGHNMEAEIFGYMPLAKGDSADNPAQKLVTTDIGLALRAFF